jgi:hypothetical protein
MQVSKVLLKESVKILQNAKFDRDKLASLRLISDIGKFTSKEPTVIVGQNNFNGDINDTLERLRIPEPVDCTTAQINPTQKDIEFQAYNKDKQQSDLSS